MNEIRTMKASEIRRIINPRAFYGTSKEEFSSICTDTRQLERGALFVAIRGKNFDGNDFAERAFELGAGGVITNRELDRPKNGAVFVVDDSNFALLELAKAARDNFQGKVFAITGSAGKTTVKDMLSLILSSNKSVASSMKSYNNFVGVPLTLLGMREEYDAAVVEIGTNSPGEVASLASITRPHVGIITNVGNAHLGGFGLIEAIADEKSSLLSYIEPFGKAVLNADNPYTRAMIDNFPCSKLSFGRSKNADFVLSSLRLSSDRILFKINGVRFSVPIEGAHNAMNVAAAVAGASLCGVSLEDAASIMSSYSMREMRLEKTMRMGVTIVNDAYNANPESMVAALDALRLMDCMGRRIAVIGDMGELGLHSEHFHRECARYAYEAGLDLIIFVGEESRAGYDELALKENGAKRMWFADGREASVYLSARAEEGDVVLFKGSRNMELERAASMLIELLSTRRRSARRSA